MSLQTIHPKYYLLQTEFIKTGRLKPLELPEYFADLGGLVDAGDYAAARDLIRVNLTKGRS